MTRPIETIRQELRAARDELAVQLERIRNDASRRNAALSADSADRAQEQENDEVLERLGRDTAQLLRQYEHAIERADHGQYGLCESCGFAIEPERLRAVPQAVHCAGCMGAKRAA